MTDHRTPEQRDADDAFEEAIRALLTAYGADDGLLLEWVIDTTQHIAEADGSSSTVTAYFTNPGAPLHRTLGLLGYVDERVRTTIRALGEVDE